MDVKKQVCAKRQALRIRIENLKITRNRLPKNTLHFVDKGIHKQIDRAERELAMLESTWSF